MKKIFFLSIILTGFLFAWPVFANEVINDFNSVANTAMASTPRGVSSNGDW